jgi:hypothetical protein
MAREPELRRRLGQRSRERAVTSYDLSVVAELIEGIYQKLLRSKLGVQ